VLTGLEIRTVEDMCRAAEAIYALGPKNVVVKGGHLPVIEAAIDVLYDGTAVEMVEAPRVDTRNTHGTGCTYASSIAAELAKGHPVHEAVRIAKAYLTAAIRAADEMKVGHGHGPLNHFLGRTIEVE
jgi:hydroxymethylpyrimidine/phosphomethylpyrimidine kinase